MIMIFHFTYSSELKSKLSKNLYVKVLKCALSTSKRKTYNNPMGALSQYVSLIIMLLSRERVRG